MAQIVAGRPFNSELSKEEQISLARERYNICRLKHEQCKISLDPDFMPARLLDLEPNLLGYDLIRLIVVPTGFKEPYATLSYCWGDVQNMRLTEDVMYEFTNKGVLRSQLPATIRDACDLCVGVGIRYLWVCSLCIVQDLELDWTEQSAAMAAIYNCSDLTISAASGRSCGAGLFGKRSYKSAPFATIKCEGPGGTTGSCCVRGGSVPLGFLEPTDLRGWTLQETLLSRRLLVRGTAQISWQCTASRWNQSGTVETASPTMDRIFPCPPLTYCLSHRVQEDDKSLETRPLGNLVPQVWQDLVSNYSRRRLSLSKDKLPAISGLARWLHRHCSADETYLAGLWRSQLPGCLLWYNNLPLPADTKKASRPVIYRAPSWSWASLDSDYLTWLEPGSENHPAGILDYHLLYRSDDIFGEVVDGYLDIEAPIKQGWLVPSRTHPEHFDFWDDNWRAELTDRRPTLWNNSLGGAHFDVYDATDLSIVDDVEPQQRAFACECLRITAVAGILVRPSDRLEPDNDKPSFDYRRQRVGVVEFKDRAAGWWDDACAKVVRLV